MKTQNQEALKIIVRAREDAQRSRKAMDNRLGRKADGTAQKTQDENSFISEDVDTFNRMAEHAREQEKECDKALEKILKRFPIYNEWLSLVKGVGPGAAAYILSEFDIEIATTISKMWQFSGMNPGMKRGKMRIAKKKYKPEMGDIVKEIKNIRSGETDYLITSHTMIRGDRLTEGFVSPFNKILKTRLLGILAPGFIKAKSPYAFEYYYPYKERLTNEDNIIINDGKARKDDGKAWKDVSKGHRDNAAKRYMIKMFLKDLYVAWRSIEGLDVRVPYAEEFLEKKHSLVEQ